MCGIAGLASKEPISSDGRARVRTAVRAMEHRGPDGSAEFQSPCGHVFLSMCRLAIMDPQGGMQPFFNEDQRIVAIANGEIYNHLALRSRLGQRHKFLSKSDCEVIPHAFEDSPSTFPESLRGMFATAVWDAERRTLVLARDRIGEKPLYLVESSEEIFFASEMKAVVAGGFSRKSLDYGAVANFLDLGWVSEPDTMFADVKKLAPGERLDVSVPDLRVSRRSYWRFEDIQPATGDAPRLVRGMLDEVMDTMVKADVPVAVALSGGLDSAVVAALAAQRSEHTTAFVVGYKGEPRQDERSDARKTAKAIKVDLVEVEVDERSLVDSFPNLCAARDDPIADIAGSSYYALSAAASSNGFPVLLQGQGSDEIFWGYDWVKRAARLARGGSVDTAPSITPPISRRAKAFVMGVGSSVYKWRNPKTVEVVSAEEIFLLSDDLWRARRGSSLVLSGAFRNANASGVYPRGYSRSYNPEAFIAAIASEYMLNVGLAQVDRLACQLG